MFINFTTDYDMDGIDESIVIFDCVYAVHRSLGWTGNLLQTGSVHLGDQQHLDIMASATRAADGGAIFTPFVMDLTQTLEVAFVINAADVQTITTTSFAPASTVLHAVIQFCARHFPQDDKFSVAGPVDVHWLSPSMASDLPFSTTSTATYSINSNKSCVLLQYTSAPDDVIGFTFQSLVFLTKIDDFVADLTTMEPSFASHVALKATQRVDTDVPRIITPGDVTPPFFGSCETQQQVVTEPVDRLKLQYTLPLAVDDVDSNPDIVVSIKLNDDLAWRDYPVTVVVKATDEAGNEAMCNFDVVLVYNGTENHHELGEHTVASLPDPAVQGAGAAAATLDYLIDEPSTFPAVSMNFTHYTTLEWSIIADESLVLQVAAWQEYSTYPVPVSLDIDMQFEGQTSNPTALESPVAIVICFDRLKDLDDNTINIMPEEWELLDSTTFEPQHLSLQASLQSSFLQTGFTFKALTIKLILPRMRTDGVIQGTYNPLRQSVHVTRLLYNGSTPILSAINRDLPVFECSQNLIVLPLSRARKILQDVEIYGTEDDFIASYDDDDDDTLSDDDDDTLADDDDDLGLGHTNSLVGLLNFTDATHADISQALITSQARWLQGGNIVAGSYPMNITAYNTVTQNMFRCQAWLIIQDDLTSTPDDDNTTNLESSKSSGGGEGLMTLLLLLLVAAVAVAIYVVRRKRYGRREC